MRSQLPCQRLSWCPQIDGIDGDGEEILVDTSVVKEKVMMHDDDDDDDEILCYMI